MVRISDTGQQELDAFMGPQKGTAPANVKSLPRTTGNTYAPPVQDFDIDPYASGLGGGYNPTQAAASAYSPQSWLPDSWQTPAPSPALDAWADVSQWSAPPEPYSLGFEGQGYQSPIVQQPAYQGAQTSEWLDPWEPTPTGGGLLGSLGGGLSRAGSGLLDFGQQIWDVQQKRNASNPTVSPFTSGGDGGYRIEPTDAMIHGLNTASSGNYIVENVTGYNLDDLPYNLGYVTDAINPLGVAAVAAGPTTPIIGSTLGGGIGRRALGEIGIDIASRVGAEQAAGDFGESIPYFGDLPPVARGLIGGLAGGIGAAGGVKAIDNVDFGAAGRSLAETNPFAAPSPSAYDLPTGAIDPTTGRPFEWQSPMGGADVTPPLATVDSPPAMVGRSGMDALAPEPRAFEEAPLGRSGIDRALSQREATTVTDGPIGSTVGQLPGVRQVRGAVNPSTQLPREVHVANLADQSVKSDLMTQFSASRGPLLDEVEGAFGGFVRGSDGFVRPKNPVPYIGPEPNPIKGTWLDIAENPRDYTLTPEQMAVLKKIEARDVSNVNTVRSEYNSDIHLTKPGNDGIYQPRINTNEKLVEQGVRTEAGLGASKVTKERVWETARQRMLSDKEFIPETDPRRLIAAHDNAVARLAGTQTFKDGVGGKTRMEVIEEIRPGLREARDQARARLTSIRNRMETALGRERNIAADMRSNQAALRRVEARMEPLETRIRALEADNTFGPELSYLSGELRQLRLMADRLKKVIPGTPKRPGLGAKIDSNDQVIRSLMREIDKAQEDVTRLAAQYANVNIPDRSGYTLSNRTFKYHDAKVTKAIDQIKQESLGPLDKVADLLDVSRTTALSTDIGPVFIHGQASLWRDPVGTIVGLAKMAKDVASGQGTGLDRIARTEPEWVKRYTTARGRALGQVSEEFDINRSLFARIPVAGKQLVGIDQALFNGVQRLEYESFKWMSKALQAVNPKMSADVADAEAINFLSKSVPSLNSTERGISPARAKLERGLVTSTSFATSPALLMKDAAMAVVKISAGQRPTGREQLALMGIITMATGIGGATALSAALTADERGLDVEEAIKRALTPGRSEFLRLQVPQDSPIWGGKGVALGGPFRSAINALSPYRYDYESRSTGWNEPDLFRWAAGRVAPLPRSIRDLIKNKDWEKADIRKGGTTEQGLRSFEYIMEQAFLPIFAGEGAAGVRRATDFDPSRAGEIPWGQIGQNVLDTWSGADVRTPTEFEQFDRKVIADPQFYDKDGKPRRYDQLPGNLKQLADELYGKPAPTTEGGIALEEITARRLENEREAVKLFEDDRDRGALRERLDEIQFLAAAERGQADRDFQIFKNTGDLPSDPNKRALVQYYDVYDKARVAGVDLDFDMVQAELARLEREWTPEQAQWVRDSTGLTEHVPGAKEIYDAKALIRDAGYWDVSEQVGELMGIGNPDKYYGDIRMDVLRQLEAQGISGLRAEQIADGAVEKIRGPYTDLLRGLRTAFLAENPEVAEALLIAGYGLPTAGTQIGLAEAER